MTAYMRGEVPVEALSELLRRHGIVPTPGMLPDPHMMQAAHVSDGSSDRHQHGVCWMCIFSRATVRTAAEPVDSYAAWHCLIGCKPVGVQCLELCPAPLQAARLAASGNNQAQQAANAQQQQQQNGNFGNALSGLEDMQSIEHALPAYK